MLHPRHKLDYFKTQQWEADWIATAQELVQEEYNRTYAKEAQPIEDTNHQETQGSTKVRPRAFAFVSRVPNISQKSTGNIFDSLPALMPPKHAESCDELMVYLSTRPEPVTDALQWWYQHRTTYPTLYRMALDYLSIPGE